MPNEPKAISPQANATSLPLEGLSLPIPTSSSGGKPAQPSTHPIRIPSTRRARRGILTILCCRSEVVVKLTMIVHECFQISVKSGILLKYRHFEKEELWRH